jgi:nucleoside-diphosphate-sugar epimerase
MASALVIGGTLFIGQELVRQLLARGDRVTILHRREGTPFGDAVREIRCDRNDAGAVGAALAAERFDVVFDNVYDWQRGTTAEPVLAAARAVRGPRRYVFTSSVAAYGPGVDHDEGGPLVADDYPDAYGRHKAQTERALFALGSDTGLAVSTVQPAFIYGPGNPFDREAFFWDRILADRPVIVPDEGARLMQFVHVRDVARALVLASERDVAVGRAYALGTYPPISQADFVEALARAADRPVRLAFVPRDRIVAAGGSLMAPPLYFGAYLDLPVATVRTGRVERELGLQPVPLEEGFRGTFDWYRRQQRPRPDFSWEDELLASVGAR